MGGNGLLPGCQGDPRSRGSCGTPSRMARASLHRRPMRDPPLAVATLDVLRANRRDRVLPEAGRIRLTDQPGRRTYGCHLNGEQLDPARGPRGQNTSVSKPSPTKPASVSTHQSASPGERLARRTPDREPRAGRRGPFADHALHVDDPPDRARITARPLCRHGEAEVEPAAAQHVERRRGPGRHGGGRSGRFAKSVNNEMRAHEGARSGSSTRRGSGPGGRALLLPFGSGARSAGS
jgi:hypothetical protein